MQSLPQTSRQNPIITAMIAFLKPDGPLTTSAAARLPDSPVSPATDQFEVTMCFYAPSDHAVPWSLLLYNGEQSASSADKDKTF